jgi:hypothetical protein
MQPKYRLAASVPRETERGFATWLKRPASKFFCGSRQLAKERHMAVHWIKDIDTGLNKAKAEQKPILVDFSAAPA